MNVTLTQTSHVIYGPHYENQINSRHSCKCKTIHHEMYTLANAHFTKSPLFGTENVCLNEDKL